MATGNRAAKELEWITALLSGSREHVTTYLKVKRMSAARTVISRGSITDNWFSANEFQVLGIDSWLFQFLSSLPLDIEYNMERMEYVVNYKQEKQNEFPRLEGRG